jgi:hemoglobin/transferrin/lactoferrin receptor protein
MNRLHLVPACVAALWTSGALAQTANPNTNTQLDRIVVSTGEPKVASETPQSVSVVTKEDIEAEQPTTIGDALTDLPGVKAIGSDRVMGESFNIRGIGTLSASDESRMIVQVDGATKFHEQYRMGSLFTDPDLYKQVEVLRGPASSTLYGSGALAGVINLTTKDASDYLEGDDDFAFREKLEFTDNREGFLTSSTAAYKPMENLELLGSFIYRRSRDFETGDGKGIRGSAFDAPSGLVKGKYTFGADRDHSIRASYQHWQTEASGNDLSQTGTQAFGDIDREVLDQTVVLGYEYQPLANPLIDLDITASYSKTEVDQTNSTMQGAFFNSALFEPVTYAYEFWQAKVSNTMEHSGESYVNYFTTGIDTAYQIRTADKASRPGSTGNGVTFHPGGTSLKSGIFLQNEWIYDDRLTLIPGIRVDHQRLEPGSAVTVTSDEVSHTGISPKIAAFYKLHPDWGVFGSVAYTERLPVLDEIYDNSSSNLNLEEETSMNYEIGLSTTHKNLVQDNDAFAAKSAFFFNRIDNLIERASTTSTYHNVGESDIMGVELEASYNSPLFFANAAYTVIRGEDAVDNTPLNSIPADEIALTLGGRMPSYDLEFGWRGLVAFEQEHRTGTTDPSGGYMIHDLFASWKPDEGYLEGAEFRLGVDNLFDKHYQEHLAGDPAKGRTVKLTVAKTF